jgi:hypothetical protein
MSTPPTTQTPLTNTTSSSKRRLVNALSSMFRNHQLRDDNLLPAQVISFNRTTNVATVQPMIMKVDTSGNNITPNQIVLVPVLSLGGGGFHISFPLVEGSLGWIYAADRDMALFQQTLTMQPPNTTRCHTFNDSMFIPDVFYKYTINASDADAMVIQSVDGTTRISISEGQVNIFAPTSVTVTTPQATFTNNVTIEGDLTVDKNVTVDGDTTVTGATYTNGGLDTTGGGSGAAVTLSENATVGGLQVYGHDHMGNGAGQLTGPMLN